MQNISDKLKVKMPKKPVVYEVLGIKNDKVNKGRKVIPKNVQVPAEDVIFDPGDEQVKQIRYSVGNRIASDPSGKEMVLPVLGEILITRTRNGMLIIQPDRKTDLALYQYLEICNYNESNPNRDKSKPAIFKRRDKQKEAEEQFKADTLRVDAESLALTMDYAELEVIAKEWGVTTANRDPYEVRVAMKAKAVESPAKFIERAKPNPVKKIEAEIEIAQTKKIFTWDEEGRKWVWLPNRHQILPVGPDSDPVEALTEYFLEEGKGNTTYKKIIAKL